MKLMYIMGKWVATEESDALAMTYKDALQLAKDSEKTIYASKIFTDLLVANEGFITNLFSEDIELGGQIRANYTDGDVINPEDAGFLVRCKREIERARFAELLGTLRTGA